jgi:tetratricopeptide (TPR) repeat protein
VLSFLLDSLAQRGAGFRRRLHRCNSMKKKPSVKVHRSNGKPKKVQVTKQKEERVVKMTLPAKPTVPRNDDPRFQQAVDNYQAGLKAMQERKFEKARGLFQKIVEGGPRDLADRAKVHLNTCNQHLVRATTSFRTPEEHYDYAVSLINVGDYVTAREHLEKILKQSPSADYACYGLAVLNCLTGHVEQSLQHLAQAIRLNRSYRFQARNDSDFRNLADDPRFTELIYPDVEEDTPGPARR